MKTIQNEISEMEKIIDKAFEVFDGVVIAKRNDLVIIKRPLPEYRNQDKCFLVTHYNETENCFYWSTYDVNEKVAFELLEKKQ